MAETVKGDPLPYSAEEMPGIIKMLDARIFEIPREAHARLAATLAELAGLRQDALRWRAVRDDLAVDGDYGNGRWRIVGNNYTPYSGPRPIPTTIDEAADRLASRSGVRKEEKA